MASFIVKANILNKECTEIEHSDVRIIELGRTNGFDMEYMVDIPDHIYNGLVDTSVDYMSKEGFKKYKEEHKYEASANLKDSYFKKSLRSLMVSSLIGSLEELSYKLNSRIKIETLQRTKKIFVRFKSSSVHTKCNWTGGYMGKDVNNEFQFFIGYEVMEKPSLMHPTMVAKYYTLIRHAEGTFAHKSTNFMEGTKLEPLHMDTSTARENFLRTYQIIDWTQERENFLRNIEQKIIDLNTKLSNYLSNMDATKLDALISTHSDTQKLLY